MKKILLTAALIPVLLVTVYALSFSALVNGIVTNQAGTPLDGVTVHLVGTKTGTITDAAGKFSIHVPSWGSTLEFSCIGYQSKKIKVLSAGMLKVKMEPDNKMLSEIVVTRNFQLEQYNKAYAQAARSRALKSEMKFTPPMIMRDEEQRPSRRDMMMDTVAFEREGYDRIVENPFVSTTGNPLSTFSIDVDAASYSNVRRFLNDGSLPPHGAVRIEELVNYFRYQYPQPNNNQPFSVNTEVAACPWNPQHLLASIGLQARRIATENLPPANLTFLIDVSGSMQAANKLPLVKSSLRLLVNQMRPVDAVSLVVYAGSAGLVLPPTGGDEKHSILQAIDRLEAGGSTAGGEGIELAYATARKNFRTGGNNRVIICTDGDFNVGPSSDDALERMIEARRKDGIFLTVLGFGTGNYQDAKMQKLANKGNGNHAYIDQLSEAKKVLVSEFGGTLFTVAKDVKLQVEFNPANVQGYRLIGYENRMLADEDFNDDQKDAGEMGSGHTVTALYELIPAGIPAPELRKVDPLKYQKKETQKPGAFTEELMTIKMRYKAPEGHTSRLMEHQVNRPAAGIEQPSENWRFAAAVAQFGMLLRQSAFKGSGNYQMVRQLAAASLGADNEGLRSEFLGLVQKAEVLSSKETAAVER